jgi:hypothetical protein
MDANKVASSDGAQCDVFPFFFKDAVVQRDVLWFVSCPDHTKCL